MKIGQTSFVVFVAELVGSALGFVTTIYFARELGAEVLGYYALALTVTSWLQISATGFSPAITKRMSEGEEEASYFTAGAIIVGAIGLVLSLLVIGLRGYVQEYVGREVSVFVVALILTGLAYSVITAALSGERKVHLVGYLSPGKVGGQSLLQLLLVLSGFGLTGLLLGHAVGAFLIGAVGFTLLTVSFERPRKRHFKRLWEFAKYSWLSGLKSRSFNDADILILGVFVPSALVGVYSVAWSLSKFLTLFSSAISRTLFPEISRADAAEDREAVSTFVTDSLRFGGLIIIPGLFGGGLLAEHLLRIYGPEFSRGSTVLVLLIFASLLYGYQGQLTNALNAIDLPDRAFRIYAVFLLSNVVLNVVLIAVYGFVGAAIATVLSAAIGVVLAFRALRSELDFDVPVSEVGKQVISALVMTVVVYVGLRAFQAVRFDHNFAIIVTLVGAGAGTYFAVIYALSAELRSVVRRNVPF